MKEVIGPLPGWATRKSARRTPSSSVVSMAAATLLAASRPAVVMTSSDSETNTNCSGVTAVSLPKSDSMRSEAAMAGSSGANSELSLDISGRPMALRPTAMAMTAMMASQGRRVVKRANPPAIHSNT